MKPNFNLKNSKIGFSRDPDSGKEDKNFNYKEPKCNQLREYALSHYSNRKNIFPMI